MRPWHIHTQWDINLVVILATEMDYGQYANSICSLYKILVYSRHREYVCQQLMLRTKFIVQNCRCVALL